MADTEEDLERRRIMLLKVLAEERQDKIERVEEPMRGNELW